VAAVLDFAPPSAVARLVEEDRWRGTEGLLRLPRLRHHPESADLVPLLTVDGPWGPITRPQCP
jgi:hypothetical protein